MQDTKMTNNFKIRKCKALFSVKGHIFWYNEGTGKKGLFSLWKCFGGKYESSPRNIPSSGIGCCAQENHSMRICSVSYNSECFSEDLKRRATKEGTEGSHAQENAHMTAISTRNRSRL